MRYKKLPKHKGIYEDVNNGRLFCQKRIKGKLYTQQCDSLKEAQHWVKNFTPDNPVFTKMSIDDLSNINGKKSATIEEVWNRYKIEHVSTLEVTSQEVRMSLEGFIAPIIKNDVRHSTPQLISQLISKSKRDYLESKQKKRTRFDNELKTLKAMFRWWERKYDPSFRNPVLREHFDEGVIRKTIKRNTDKMTEDDLVNFLKEMYRINAEDGLFAMLAEMQYLTTGRIQEPVGITIDKVNLPGSILTIDQAIGFTRSKKHDDYLKNTKTVSKKTFKLKGRLREIVLTLINRGLETVDFPVNFYGFQELRPVKFLFHIKGRPLTYRQIQYRYNEALKNLELYPQFTSTHIMRHASSNHIRKGLGLDHAQVAGDWRTSSIAEIYAGTQKEYRDESVEFLENLSSSLAKSSK